MSYPDGAACGSCVVVLDLDQDHTTHMNLVVSEEDDEESSCFPIRFRIEY